MQEESLRDLHFDSFVFILQYLEMCERKDPDIRCPYQYIAVRNANMRQKINQKRKVNATELNNGVFSVTDRGRRHNVKGNAE